jgi:streptogramin lyase
VGTKLPSKMIIVAIISASIVVAAAISLYYSQTTAPTQKPETGQQEQPLTNANVGQSDTSNSNNSAIVISSPYAKEFKLPKDSWPNGIVVDNSGTVWTVGAKSRMLVSISSEGLKSSRPIPDSNETTSLMVWSMLIDKTDGSILFSGSAKSPIFRFDPKTEVFQLIGSPSGSPMQIKTDKGGNIWYTLPGGAIGALQELGRRGSHIYDDQELGLGEDSFPTGLFLQESNLWVTKSLEGKILLFNITYADDGRTIKNLLKTAEFPQQGTATLVSPTDIVVRNGSAWLTEHETSFLTEYDLKTDGIKRYPTALHPTQITTLPYWIAQDVNGTGVWFNEHRGNRIAFFDFANRTLTEYEVPTRNPQMGYIANVLTVAADPADESRAWFTELTEDKIGYVDRSVPLPFDIHASEKQIILEKGQKALIDLEITRNPEVKLFNNTLSFNVSSSAVTSGLLLNATAKFSQASIDLSKFNGIQSVTLELKDEGIQKGQHILAVSASDGAVTRTVYLDLTIM